MHKAYIVLFTCSTSRAVIIDLFYSTSKNYVNSIKKFIARRGCPKNIVPDNGKVFTSFCVEQGITWLFKKVDSKGKVVVYRVADCFV